MLRRLRPSWLGRDVALLFTGRGLSNLPSQIAGSVSPALAGYLMQTVALDLPLELAAFFQAIDALLYYRFFHGTRPPEEQGP